MATAYECISSVTADGNIPVNKYRSKKTGLNVFVAEVEGPLVNGFFCLGNNFCKVCHVFSRIDASR